MIKLITQIGMISTFQKKMYRFGLLLKGEILRNTIEFLAFNIPFEHMVITRMVMKTGGMSQWAKVFACKPNELSSILGICGDILCMI